MIKVSVIIPVYNVESYLSECLDSIINQTLKDIEIICIDDCSTDNSYNILLEYANKDSRIKIIKNIENNGVGFARNVGQFSAIGDYIYFIDPDDYISLNFLEELYNTAVKYNSDIVNTNNIYNNENDIISRFWGSSDSINVKNDYEVTINFNNIHPSDNNLRIYYTLWTKLFKRSFILENNICSPENKIGAAYDAYFVFKVLLYNPKSSFNNKAVYYYRIRGNSIIRSSENYYNIINNIINNYYNIIDLYISNNPSLLYYLYINMIATLLNLFDKYSFDNSVSSLYILIKEFINKIYIDSKSVDFNNYFENNIYNEYILFYSNISYENYIINKNLLINIKKIDDKIDKLYTDSNSRLDLFSIKNNKEYFTIILFGIKIVIKKKK